MQIARDLPGLSGAIQACGSEPATLLCLNCDTGSYTAGAELANVVNEGALECARRDGTVITSLDLYNGIDRILQVRTLWSAGLSTRQLLLSLGLECDMMACFERLTHCVLPGCQAAGHS